jgi:LuxR family maltose regulon positive regulatory protein
MTYAAGARAALRRSDWVRAQDDLDRADGLVWQMTHALPHVAVKIRLDLARAHISLGSFPAAAELIGEIGAILHRRADLGVLREQWEELQSQIESDRRTDGGWESSLTPAELRLLPLLTTHLSFREIAERLFVSRNTVKTQAISVYRKLGVSSRSEAIDKAVSLGLVEAAGLPVPRS